MNNDYELGRLAEELIASRHAKMIERYEATIKNLESSNYELKSELEEAISNRRYYKERYDSGSRYCSSTTTLTYVGFDEVTKELKESRDKVNELESELETINNTLNSRLNEIVVFTSLPWYGRMVYKFETNKESNKDD